MNLKLSVRSVIAGLGLAIAWAQPVFADEVDNVDAVEVSEVDPGDYAVKASLASQHLLLDVSRFDSQIVAIGARGHILISSDNGDTWEQAAVPSHVALTAVHFTDEKRGWAVGHDAVILRTIDGGATWERVHYAPEEERPLLDVWFRDDARTGFAIGAYGYFLTSNDGGRTWSEGSIDGDGDGEPDDFHLNQVSESKDGVLYIAAEAGTAYISKDQGDSWSRIYPPYEGSFFGSLPLLKDSVLFFGLQGNVFRSDDGGKSWEAISVESTATLNEGTVMEDGTVILVGNEGAILVSKSGGRSFVVSGLDDRKAIANLIQTAEEDVLLVGEMGVRKLSLQDLK